MQINLTPKEFRRLLDLVYIGNWVLNSTRGEDRFADYDNLESKLFALSPALSEHWNGTVVPSRAYQEGGIHEAIACYEDNVFYEILAEELSRRDMDYPEITDDNYDEIVTRMDRYMSEFELSGVDHLVLDFPQDAGGKVQQQGKGQHQQKDKGNLCDDAQQKQGCPAQPQKEREGKGILAAFQPL